MKCVLLVVGLGTGLSEETSVYPTDVRNWLAVSRRCNIW